MIDLLKELRTAEYRKILFAGIGNVLKSDDGVGVFLARQLIPQERAPVILAEVSIENYIGKINAQQPDVLVLIDCVDFGMYPGYFNILPVSELMYTTTNTHNISLRQVGELFDMPVLILGIQPCSIAFGEGLSLPVKKTADMLARLINQKLIKHFSEERNYKDNLINQTKAPWITITFAPSAGVS